MVTTVQLFSGAELERVHRWVTVARVKREAWQECYTRIQTVLLAAYQGRPSRTELQLLEATAARASRALALSRAEEEAASLAYLNVTGGLS